MRDHKDKTAETAIGDVNKEWRYMAKLALELRGGHCNPVWANEQEKLFTGIFKRLLTDPIEEVQKQTKR